MKTLSLPYFTNRALKNNDYHPGSQKYTNAANVLIIFTATGSDKIFHQVRRLQERFQADKKRVSFLYLLLKEENRPNSALDDHMVALEAKNVSLLGDISQNEVKEMLNTKFDFMINADMYPNMYSEYIMAKSKSNCKIGRFLDNKDKFYDLMIATNEVDDQEYYLDQVYHYIKQL